MSKWMNTVMLTSLDDFAGVQCLDQSRTVDTCIYICAYKYMHTHTYIYEHTWDNKYVYINPYV